MDDKRASDFGLMKIDDTGRITVAEKPNGDALKTISRHHNPRFDSGGRRHRLHILHPWAYTFQEICSAEFPECGISKR